MGIIYYRTRKCVVILAQILAILFRHVLEGRSPMPPLSRNGLVGRHVRLSENWMQIVATHK